MKKIVSTTVTLSFLAFGISQALAQVPASCEGIKESIARKIISNGVPAADFRLDIVANERVAQSEGRSVGNCGGTHQIIYVRGSNIGNVPANTQAAPAVVAAESHQESQAHSAPATPYSEPEHKQDAESSNEDEAIGDTGTETPVGVLLEYDAAPVDLDPSQQAEPMVEVTPTQVSLTSADSAVIIHQ